MQFDNDKQKELLLKILANVKVETTPLQLHQVSKGQSNEIIELIEDIMNAKIKEEKNNE